jgi:hypothetical protein
MKDTFQLSVHLHGGHRWIQFNDMNRVTHTVPVGSIRLQNRFVCESKDIDKEPDEMECSISYDGNKYVVDYITWMEINDYLILDKK